MSDFHFYEPAAGHGLPHDPWKAIVAPRPIGWISTIDRNGRINLAPYSFFNGISDAPPMVMFSSQGHKDSVRNIEETGQFVCNLATMRHAQQMNLTSAPLPHGECEMELAGLQSAPSRVVKPPRVADAPAALECEAVQIIRLMDMEGRPLEAFMVIGQIVGVHIDKACLTPDGNFDMTLARTIARCGYRGDYAEVTQLFEMIRPG